MARGQKITVMVAAVAVIASTPLFWLLDSPDTGQLVGASVQAGTGVAALVWALLQSNAPGTRDFAVRTGKAHAEGGVANSGVRRPGGAGSGSAGVADTGEATAQAPDSRANTGIDYS